MKKKRPKSNRGVLLAGYSLANEEGFLEESRAALGFVDDDEERALVALVAKHGAAPDPWGRDE